MRSKTELKASIERYLLEKLENAKCIKGQVTGEYKPDARTLLTINGTRTEGSSTSPYIKPAPVNPPRASLPLWNGWLHKAMHPSEGKRDSIRRISAVSGLKTG